MEIRTRTLSEAWPITLRKICQMGEMKYIPHHMSYALELCEPLMVTIREPLVDIIPPNSGWDLSTLELYAKQLISPDGKGFSYTYGERFAKGDQINEAIKKLSGDPGSRQAVMSTWNAELDNSHPYPPCMMVLDFKVRDGKVCPTAYLRSNDMMRAYPQNVYGIATVAKHVSKTAFGFEDIGRLTTISSAAHINAGELQDAVMVAFPEETVKQQRARYLGLMDPLIGGETLKMVA